MNAKLVHISMLDDHRPCSGCELWDPTKKKPGCRMQCTKAANKLRKDESVQWYFFDPLVYATNRLKGLA